MHDFSTQGQGQGQKVTLSGLIVTDAEILHIPVSLYRPSTKSGDPRIWPSRFAQHSAAEDVYAIFVADDTVCFLNLSQSKVANLSQLSMDCPATAFLRKIGDGNRLTANELLAQLREIASMGALPAVCAGDTAVGRTIETALGIPMNSKKAPDFKGIEIKSGRIPSAGRGTRQTLFACVPDWNLSPCKSSAEILNQFGYERNGRRQLYCTVSTLQPNSQGLQLKVDSSLAHLVEGAWENHLGPVAFWRLEKLHAVLESKHKETFWVHARKLIRKGTEHFILESVTHTKGPSASQFDQFVIDGVVTLDHLVRCLSSGRVGERGPLFKVQRQRLSELFTGNPQSYQLVG